MNPLETQHKKFLTELQDKYLKDNPEVIDFLNKYLLLVHTADDCQDEKFDPQRLNYLTSVARDVYSHSVFIQYKSQLAIVDELINNTYADVLEWENSDVEWKRGAAEALSHVGYNMLFAVVRIVCGREAMRECSRNFREFAHLTHFKHKEPLVNIETTWCCCICGNPWKVHWENKYYCKECYEVLSGKEVLGV